MTPIQLEIQAIAVVVAVACSLLGVFLVLRQMAMMSDAISHAILPGLVLAFFLTEDLNSPLLILAAAATGVLTVALVEGLRKTRLLKEDAAIGVVFPALFSIGVILIAQFADDVHLDTDAVLLGELAFAPFDRVLVGGADWGPKSLLVMGSIAVINLVFLLAYYKELKLATFDAGLAAALGFMPGVLHYALMALVSVTAVGAFDAVGAILVVAFMVGPPATAYLLTDRLALMLFLSALIGAGGALSGYWLAHALDASIAGAMAAMVGAIFLGVLLLAPGRGVVAVVQRRLRQRWAFAAQMLTIHLLHHEGTPEEGYESRIDHLQEHLHWEAAFAKRVVQYAQVERLVEREHGRLRLTEKGRVLASEAVVNE